MFKLAVITITCRPNPRLIEAGRCLAASLARAPGVDLHWFIVDEKGRTVPDLITQPGGDLSHYTAVASRFEVTSLLPCPSLARDGEIRLPAHNSARNAGLHQARVWGADYVMFLNDCNMVTADWVSVAKDCGAQNLGWSCKTRELVDLVVPIHGILRHHDHHDRLRPLPAMSAARQCWGAPLAAFVAVDGFDLVYDGQKKGNDIDCAVRLNRYGIAWITTERALTVQLKRTKQDADVTHSKEALNGVKNRTQLNALLRDKTRILPLHGAGFGNIAVGAPAPAAEDPAAPQPPVSAEFVGGAGPAWTPADRAARPVDDAPQVKIVTVAGTPAAGGAITVAKLPLTADENLALELQPWPDAQPAQPPLTADEHLAKAKAALEASKALEPPPPLTESENELADEYDTGGGF